MKNLGLRRLLTVSAAGSLLLGVQGCGDSDESLANSDESITDLACKGYKKCDKASFDEQYDSVKDCVDENLEYFEEEYDEILKDYGKDCAKAYRAYYNCYYGEYQNSCSYDDIEEKCEAEYDKLEEECGFDYSEYN